MTMTSTSCPTPSSDTAAQANAFAMRSTGSTYREIASLLGFATPNVAAHAVHLHAQRLGVAQPGRTASRSEAARRAARTRYSTAARSTARRFGVEIEVVGLSPASACRALVAAGINAQDESYNHSTRSYWKVTTDSSVNGCEVVSPPMSGDDAFTALATVCAALQAAGGRIDRSTGVHVHHEVSDLSGDELANLVLLFAGQQTTMDALVAPSRRGRPGSYPCGAFTGGEAQRFADAFRASRGDRRAVRGYGIGGRPDSRYRALNVHSFATYGTVEFRQHQGTLNASKIAAWVRFGQAVIEAAKTTSAIAETDAAFIDRLTSFGLPAETAAFLTSRIATLA